MWKQSSPSVWDTEVCPAQDGLMTILLIQSWKLLSLHALFDPLSFLFSLMFMKWLGPVPGLVLNTFTLQVDLSENKFFFHIKQPHETMPHLQLKLLIRGEMTKSLNRKQNFGFNLLIFFGPL